MSFPKHKNPSPQNAATAPYNFVPLPDKIEAVQLEDIPDHDKYDTQRYTGRIEVKLTTASPLYIRTGLSPADFAEMGKKSFADLTPVQRRKIAQFFHIYANPVIPGSSLRGMLRAMIEIVTYGKVQPVSDKPLVYRAVGDRTSLGNFYRTQLLGPNKSGKDMHYDYPSSNVRGGYLAKDSDGNWAIRPAQTHFGETFVHVDYDLATTITGGRYGRQRVYDVFVSPAKRNKSNRGKRGSKTLFLDLALTDTVARTKTNSSMVPAKLIESGKMGKPGFKHGKHMHCAIYEPDTTKPLIKIPREIWEIYVEDRDLNRGIPTRAIKNVGDPLFYLVDHKGNLIFFGPTMMFRLPYTQSPADLGPKELHQDIKTTKVDFAEAMFGYIKTKDTQEKAYAGRIFVEDAQLANDQNTSDIWLSDIPITPKILSGPKPTSFQLYLTQQDPNNNKELDHYAPTSPHKTVIRGHKLYWHKGANPSITHPDPQNAPEKQITQIKPLKAGVSFTFTIHFENLSESELGALWWVLRLGADDNYRLKLGMGKPLGMGAVKTEPTLHLTNRKMRYQSLFNSNNWQNGATGKDNDNADKLADKFEDCIKRHHADAFGGDGRIEQLRALLSWPGPAPQFTEYITDLKSFSRDRKVLPTPVWVLEQNPPHNDTLPQQSTTTATSQQHTPKEQNVYPKNFIFKVKLSGKWDKKIKGLTVKMPKGEIGHLSIPSRKRIERELGNTVELIVADYKNGVCVLDFH